MIYEGSTNYETHIISQLITNDEVLYNMWSQTAQFIEKVENLAKLLEVTFEQEMPKMEGIWKDLLGAAFSEVDWLKVAGGLMKK